MTKTTKYEHAVLGTISVAVTFDPSDLGTAVSAEATIRAVAAGLATVRVVDVATRMGKVPVAQGAAQRAPAPVLGGPGSVLSPAMPPVPAGLRR